MKNSEERIGGSYDTGSFTTDISNEIKRLETQVELFWDDEKKLYDDLFSKSVSTVLECGSGPGFLISKLATEYPLIKFHSLEIDPTFVEFQRNMVKEKNLSNVSVKSGSIENSGIKDGICDVIVLRLVLEHVENVDKVLSELKRMLKPGGILVLIDNDFDQHLITEPRIPSLDMLYKAYSDMRISEGGDPYIGRKLPLILKSAGFKGLNFGTISAHSGIKGDKIFLKSESSAIGMTLVQKGFLAEADFNNLVKSWGSILHEKNHLFMRLLFFCTGVFSDSNMKDTEAIQSPVSEEEAVPTDDLLGRAEENPLEFLRMETARILKIDENAINEDADILINIGLDSIGALDLADSIYRAFGCEIPTVFLLGNTTLKKLLQEIERYSGISTGKSNHEVGEI